MARRIIHSDFSGAAQLARYPDKEEEIVLEFTEGDETHAYPLTRNQARIIEQKLAELRSR